MKNINSKPKDDQTFLNGIGKFNLLVQNNLVKVDWYQNSKKIDENKSILKFEKVTNGRIRSLIIKNCKKEDFTNYSVECNGEKYTFKLNMIDREKYLSEYESVFFLTELIKDNPEKGLVRHSALVTNPFTPVQWFKNGKEISKSESCLKFEQMNIGCERILITKNCKNDDKAEYTVKCSAMPQGKSNSNKSTKSSNANSQNSKSDNKRQTEPASRNQSKDTGSNNEYDTGSNESFTKQKEYEQKSVWSKGNDGEWLRSYKVKEWKMSELIDNQFKSETKDTKWIYNNSKCIWLPAEELSQ